MIFLKTPNSKKCLLKKSNKKLSPKNVSSVSYTHLRAHETVLDLVCRLLLETKNKYTTINTYDYYIKTHTYTTTIQ